MPRTPAVRRDTADSLELRREKRAARLVACFLDSLATLERLWRAEAPGSFDFAVFKASDYYGAVNQKVTSENLTKVLYPNDEQVEGKQLRLEADGIDAPDLFVVLGDRPIGGNLPLRAVLKSAIRLAASVTKASRPLNGPGTPPR